MSHLNALSVSQKYTLWNRAIAEYFLSNNSNEQEIYLTISPRSLAAAFAKVQVTPLSPKEAEQDFVDVVSSAYRHRVLSYSAGFSVLHGDDENGFPKYIAFLALCVLAAYRMHSDEEVSTGAYYLRLAELLRCKIVRNFPEGFHTDEFEKLWKLLNKWLKQKKSLLLAMPEANTAKKIYIAFPLTHVPLRQVDIEKLPNFFAWAGYTPGQIAPINKLEVDISRWGSCYFTLTGKKALADKRLKAVIAQVNNELELWDGAINDSYGRRSASVEILLDIVRRQPQFSFLPRCPDSFPSFFNCEELYLESSGEGWYNPISLGEKNGRDLHEGFSWSTKSNNIQFILQRGGCSAIALAPSSDYTGFVSRHSLPSGIACNVLVHEDVAKNAREYFEEISSRSSNPIHDKRLPDGWCLFRDIKAEKYVANIPSGLESLYVESAVDIVLSGGLRLGKKSAWLLGAPPRLMITGLQEGQQPKIDGIPITIAEDGTLIDLSHLNDPFKIFDSIRQTYLRYLESPFRVRYEALMSERRAMLDQDGQLWREPLLEPIAPYLSSGFTIAEACQHFGINSAVANFINGGLFSPQRQIYQHQFQAWELSRQGRAVVITSGTGSGKTECYLIPIFAYLVEEALGNLTPGLPAWVSSNGTSRKWWRQPRQGWVSQRQHESPERPSAVRALLLYPLNALIEDQLTRIRRACDNPHVQQWREDNMNGNRFWFGRYNGATPVAGLRMKDGNVNSQKQGKLKKQLLEMDNEWSDQVSDEELIYYFQNPDGSEMWSRWDMQDKAPDILITNYSMLNIMLMRSVENDIFEQTKQWLEQDRQHHIFHLVIDELHTYRGTPGTEVGYLLRALLNRIGLEPDSPQLRIIATSASISKDEEKDEESLDYLEQFFGRDRNTFSILSGEQQNFPTSEHQPNPLEPYKETFAQIDNILNQSQNNDEDAVIEEAATTLANTLHLPNVDAPPRQVLTEGLNHIQAFGAVQTSASQYPLTVKELAEAVFGDVSLSGQAAARGLARTIVLARNSDNEALLPLRSHFFFHNAGRIWACVNPNCSGRSGVTPSGEQTPPVGKLFLDPKPKCDRCNSRVIELLYCQSCGEVFLGGFKREDQDSSNAWYLSPDYPYLENVPDKAASLSRTFGEFLVFWPANGRPLIKQTQTRIPRWQWQEKEKVYEWRPALLNHLLGRLTLPASPNTASSGSTAGYVFIAPKNEANAFPSKCPHCEADWRGRRVSSSIRDLGSGFQRVVQVLSDALMRQMSPEIGRKLVLFSDSRQDAAKLSTGIKRDHYLDTVRQIAYERLLRQAQESETQYLQAQTQYRLASELFNLQRQIIQDAANANMARYSQLFNLLPTEIVGVVISYASTGGVGNPPLALTPPTSAGGFICLPFNFFRTYATGTVRSLINSIYVL